MATLTDIDRVIERATRDKTLRVALADGGVDAFNEALKESGGTDLDEDQKSGIRRHKLELAVRMDELTSELRRWQHATSAALAKGICRPSYGRLAILPSLTAAPVADELQGTLETLLQLYETGGNAGRPSANIWAKEKLGVMAEEYLKRGQTEIGQDIKDKLIPKV